MSGVNKVIIIGHLGEAPDVGGLPNGDAVSKFSVATSETWIDKQTSDRKESTEWHRIILYRRLAEIAAKYLQKGSKVYIEGKLKTRKWQDKNGIERYVTEIIGSSLQMLDSNKKEYNKPQPAPKKQPAQESNQNSKDEFGDDDVPF